MMLARVADSLYWIGRYIERAEHHSRLCDVMLTAMLDQNDAAVLVARRAISSQRGEAEAAIDAGMSMRAAQRLVLERANTASVVVSLSRARENARQVRDQITTETWERLNLLFLRVTAPSAERAFVRGPAAFLQGIIADLHLFKGALDATMSHGQGWRFLLLGLYLERAQLIARLLNVCFGGEAAVGLDDHMTQMSVLRMACGLEPYLRVYTAEMEPRRLLGFLLFDDEFPHSVRFSIKRMEEHLSNLAPPGHAVDRSHPERLAARLSGRLEFADLDESLPTGALLAAVAQECSAIHEAVYETFVSYPLEQRLPA